ncbi:uncharacterized protein LOC117139121 isoform X1 [Drosophila mauritiana]|uniref:Uncharacterized protein LOC117139121 isoform X1 n=1 Tax=Drosophila mauritiana TaxID=7226 RepID=A0A6P8JML9_DROMA|nr:uncharacterized protein LOC117139121 isoform X1 [Drosophila mauritiana]
MSGIDDEASAIANATAGTKRSNDGGAGEQVSRLKGRKIAKLDRTTCSAGPSTTHPATTIFALNTYCWDMILSYLSLSEQLHLAALSHQLKMLIESLQHRYNIIEESVTGSIGESELQQLLDIVREHVISYESPLDPLSGQDRHLWMLRDYCPNLRHLKMSFRRPRWHDLLQLKNLTSLHASLHFSNAGLYKNFIISLSALPHLKKLKLEATSYTGDGLHALDKLEYLEIGNQHGFDASILASCCMTMKKLCHLNMGENTANLEGEDFRVIVRRGHNLERLAFTIIHLKENVPYDTVHQLPKLKHLQLWHWDINASFIEKLIQKPGTPLESLILVGDTLEPEQVYHICEISSLRELSVACRTDAARSFLRLKHLEILDVKMSDVSNDELLALLEGCALLNVLGVRYCRLVTSEFVLKALSLYSDRKIKIYLHESSVDWCLLHLPVLNGNTNIQFINGYLKSPILINNG